ncbi:hypothetical protein HJC23_002987 [Cyclotella cryptica]|uniref:Uncharacterized protein n=1 Tax=Cyclotella cryptica TaxID=29204 RepID=A0ABD3PT27_9STRA
MTSTGSASTSTAESITEPIVRKILTGVPVSTQADMLDLGSLHVSELNLLKKNDPFMYYSIPGATNPRLSEQDIDLVLPSLITAGSRPNSMGGSEQATPRHAPRNRLRSVSDSSLFVERRSRISYESHFDEVMQSIIGEMDKLQAQNATCKMKRSLSCSRVSESHLHQDQIVHGQAEQDVCRKPKCGSGQQDSLFSIFESIWEDDCDEK